MPKPNTNPVIFENLVRLRLSSIKKQGYLKAYQWISGHFWVKGLGLVLLEVNLCSNAPYITFTDHRKDKPIQQKINLISVPSNLGKGVVWLMVCPVTGKYCRVLYYANDQLVHRSSLAGFYKQQTQSKQSRALSQTVKILIDADFAQRELTSSQVLGSYANKPTKKYLQLQKQIARAKPYQNKSLNEIFFGKPQTDFRSLSNLPA